MKQRMHSLVIIILASLAFVFGEVHINQTTSPQQNPIAPSNYISNWSVEQAQNISGKLLISPGSRSTRSQLIETAPSLKIRLYSINHQESKLLLKKLANQGKKIKLILEDNVFGKDNAQNTIRGPIQVRNDSKLGSNYMHAKTFLADNFYIIQTANLTQSAFHKQREYYLIGHQPQIIYNLHVLFDKDREGKTIEPQDIHPNILLCPIDCRGKIIGLIRSAKSSIYIQNQYIQDPGIQTLLKGLSGVDIKITLPDNKNNLQTALNFADRVRLLKKPYIHAKAMLIDKRHLLISSINFSSNSMDKNREIGIIVNDKQSIDSFLKQFYEDWDRARLYLP